MVYADDLNVIQAFARTYVGPSLGGQNTSFGYFDLINFVVFTVLGLTGGLAGVQYQQRHDGDGDGLARHRTF